MPIRKIQVIAGATYTISLPKEWILKNKLKEKKELNIEENADGTLVLTPFLQKAEKVTEVVFNIDPYLHLVDKVLFAFYYLGVEKITLFSKNALQKETKTTIRKNVSHMSGTEITYEDEKKVIITVLLDKHKINIPQVLYRMALIIESMVFTLSSDDSTAKEEIMTHENEIDRLYHLVTKILALSLSDVALLRSSGVERISFIPSYIHICKKLESMGDTLYTLSFSTEKKEKETMTLLEEIVKEVKLRITFLLSEKNKGVTTLNPTTLKKFHEKIKAIETKENANALEQVLRYLGDIEEEIINLYFSEQFQTPTFLSSSLSNA